MIAARDCKDIPDLWTRLKDIFIDEQHLNFGTIKFKYSGTEDFLDQGITDSLFPELDIIVCPILNENLGLVESDDEEKFMNHVRRT
jgi:hypothetical protein